MILFIVTAASLLSLVATQDADPHVMFYFDPTNSVGARQLRELRKNIERARARVHELSVMPSPTTKEEQDEQRNEMFGAAIYEIMQKFSQHACEHERCSKVDADINDPCVTVDYDCAKEMCRVTYKCKIDEIAAGQKSVSAITEPEARRKFKAAVL